MDAITCPGRPICDKSFDHDVPSLGAKFNAFFETYAPGQGLKKQRGDMHALRSGILHGTTLIAFDVDFKSETPIRENMARHRADCEHGN
jgi:hypothetical protein